MHPYLVKKDTFLIYSVFADEPNLFVSSFVHRLGGSVAADVSSETPTQIEYYNSSTDITTQINGNGLTLAGLGSSTRGTITSIDYFIRGAKIGSVSNVSWDLAAFIRAMDDLSIRDDDSLVSLLNQQPITVDLRGATSSVDFEDVLANVSVKITVPTTIFDSPYSDSLLGTAGPDTFNFGGAIGTAFLNNVIEATQGNDKYIFTNLSPNEFIYFDYDLNYSVLSGAINATLSGRQNLGEITGPGFTDTMIDISTALSADGVGIAGSVLDDTFTIDVVDGQFFVIEGKEGRDTYNIFLDGGGGEISFRYGENSTPNGLHINLATGVIADDGLGNSEVISLFDNGGYLQIRGTIGNDTFVGSSGNEYFIADRGNDSIDGGAGVDVLRYDFSQVSSVRVEMASGTVTGVWDGHAFEDTFTNIEYVEGSPGRDFIRGSTESDRLYGNGGDDGLYGGDGNDALYGGDGNDDIYDGKGSDLLFGGAGDDETYLRGSDEDGFDIVDLHSGTDTVYASLFTEGSVLFAHTSLVDSDAVTVTIDRALDTAVIDKGSSGTTTINDVSKISSNGVAGFFGSRLDDIFSADIADGHSINLTGGRGNDTYNLTGAQGRVALNYSNDVDFSDPETGLHVNLATGIVSNDGFGGTDTITGLGEGELVIIGTNFADTFIGGATDDIFSLNGGNDIIDGAGGEDEIRIIADDPTTGVVVDLVAGTIQGQFAGLDTLATVANIENVSGSDVADVITGTNGANSLSGQDGNDIISGGNGADSLNGNAGDDFVYGNAFQLGYAVAEANQVFRLYQAAFNRAPDEAGHKLWTQELFSGAQTLAQVRDGFVGSQEFAQIYNSLDDVGFVKQLYINVLDRDFGQGEVSQAEIDSWTNQITEDFTRADVVNGFAESPQMINNTSNAANSLALDRTPSEWSDDVYRLYRATLDRDPDATGFQGWANNLAGGASFDAVITGFTNSVEFSNAYGALADPEDFVKLLYSNVLDRDFELGEVSQSEIDGWTSQLGPTFTRANIVAGFSQSVEFSNNTAADLVNWVRSLGVDDTINGGAENNVLAGGLLSDEFVFDQADLGLHTVLDLEAWDFLKFVGFGYTSGDEALASMEQDGNNIVFSDSGTNIILRQFTLDDLTDDMLLV